MSGRIRALDTHAEAVAAGRQAVAVDYDLSIDAVNDVVTVALDAAGVVWDKAVWANQDAHERLRAAARQLLAAWPNDDAGFDAAMAEMREVLGVD